MRASGRLLKGKLEPVAHRLPCSWPAMRSGLLLGAAACALLGGRALAQTTPATAGPVTGGADAGEASPGMRTYTPVVQVPLPVRPSPTPPPAADDGLGERGFYLEADQVVRDDAANTITAQGGVEARYQGRVLRAETVIYDLTTGVARADGEVEVISADGSTQTARQVVLDRDLTAGFALGFATRLEGSGALVAESLVRRSPTVDELNRAVYTPCPVCAENHDQAPTWSIRARQVVRDRRRQIVYYRDTVIQVLGVPVFYAPVFWHPDPEAPRQSGLLAPIVSASRIRGVSYEQPYLHVINPSQDVIVRLQLNSNAAPFVKLDARRRFYSGYAEARVGYTYERDLDNNGNRIGERTNRTYILSRGQFAIDDHWRWGFTAERASEPLVFDKYDVANVFAERGPYAVDDRRLISQVYASRQDERSYLSAAAMSVQGLRVNDRNGALPLIAPLIEARWEPGAPVVGGRLRLRGSAVVLTRDESPTVPDTPGVDSARASVEIDWRRAMTTGAGLRVEPFVLGRGDIYGLRDLPTTGARSGTITRGFGVAGVDLTWPFFRQTRGATVILEPVVQLAFGNRADPDPRLQNEDSRIFEFDSTNLFRINRSPGFDLYEGGNRLNVGGRASITLPDGRSGNLLIGQSFRSTFDPTMPLRTGLATTRSDYIVAAEVTPLTGLSLFARTRLDPSNLSANRIEAGADYTGGRAAGSLRYLRETQSPGGGPVEDLDFRGEVFVTSRWGFSVYGVRDLEAGSWRQRDFGIVYRDDCTRIEVVYKHGETFNRTLGPSESFVVRLTLATLGNTGYGR